MKEIIWKNTLAVVLVIGFPSLSMCPPRQPKERSSCQIDENVVEGELANLLKTGKTSHAGWPTTSYCIMESKQLLEACNVLLHIVQVGTKFSIVHKKAEKKYECKDFRILWNTSVYGTTDGVILPLIKCPEVKVTKTEPPLDGEMEPKEYDEFIQYYILGFGNTDEPLLFISKPDKKTGLLPKLDKLLRSLSKLDKKHETNKPGESPRKNNSEENNLRTPLLQEAKSDQPAYDIRYYVDDSKTIYKGENNDFAIYKFTSKNVSVGLHKNVEIYPYAIIRLDEHKTNNMAVMLMSAHAKKMKNVGSSSSPSGSVKSK